MMQNANAGMAVLGLVWCLDVGSEGEAPGVTRLTFAGLSWGSCCHWRVDWHCRVPWVSGRGWGRMGGGDEDVCVAPGTPLGLPLKSPHPARRAFQ